MSGMRGADAARSVALVLVGIGIGLSLSAVSGGREADLAGAERVVIGEAGGTREVVLGKVDDERFGVLVRDLEGKAEVFLGLRGEGPGERAECRARRGPVKSRYEAVMAAWRDGTEMWTRRYKDGDVSLRAGIETSGDDTEFTLESEGRDDWNCGAAMRWWSGTGALELETCFTFLGREWRFRKQYTP